MLQRDLMGTGAQVPRDDIGERGLIFDEEYVHAANVLCPSSGARPGNGVSQYESCQDLALLLAVTWAGAPIGNDTMNRVPAEELSTRTDPCDNVTKPLTMASP